MFVEDFCSVAELALFLLGAPRLEVNGRSRHMNTRKAMALAAYLAVTAVAHRRDSLTSLLWPELDQQRSRAALRTTLSVLKKAVGDDWLHVVDDSIGFAPGYWCDVRQFQEFTAVNPQFSEDVQTAQLQEVVDLYQGDFLSGFTLGDSVAFDEWQYFQAEALRQQLGVALTRLVDWYQNQGQLDRAIQQSQRRLTLDPLHEPAQQQLMALYAQSGQPAAALRQYEQLCRLLQDELGVPPSPETVQLYEAIKNGRFSQPQPTPSATPTWPDLYPSQSFVGRTTEMAQIEARLADPTCRLLTLVGPGGIGKTRLAWQAGRQLPPNLFATAVFIPLAAVTAEPDHIVSAIADACDFHFYGREAPQTQLINFLREKEWLLVLDNFEHLQSCRTLLLELLQNAPGIKLLVTSRERLQVQGEWLLEVQGLPLPKNEMEANDALHLFQLRAQQIAPNLDLFAAENDIMRICQLVQGLPPGIELAAAWVRVLALPEIAAEIEKSLDFLRTQAADVPERHRSLRAVFNHSWQLLDESDRQAFRRLAVFQGGFTRETAVAITATTLDQISSLLDKSLLRYDFAGRYHIPEALHPFAREQLQAHAEEEEQIRVEHGRFFAAFMQNWGSDLRGHGQQKALTAIATEMDNIRFAWNWAATAHETEMVAQCLPSLSHFLEMRNQFNEGMTTFSIFVDWPEWQEGDRRVKAEGVARYGRFCQRLGDFGQAEKCLTQSLQLCQAMELETNVAFVLNELGYVAWSRGQFAEARQYYEQSLDIYRQTDDRWGESQVLNNLAILPQDLAQTRELLQQSLHIARQLGDLWSEARVLNNLGFAVAERVESRRLWEECATLCRQLDDRYLLTFPLINLGHAARTDGQFERARKYYEESLNLCRAIGYQQGMARNWGHLGRAAYNLGDFAAAHDYCQRGLTLAEALGDQRGIGLLTYTLGQIVAATGDDDTAVSHYNQSLTTFQQAQDRQGEAWPLLGLAEYHQQLGDLATAASEAQNALTIFEEVGDKTGKVLAQALLATCMPDDETAKMYLRDGLETAVSLQSPPLIYDVLLSFAKWFIRQGDLLQVPVQAI